MQPTSPIRNRIKGHRQVRAGDLVLHEWNFRHHSLGQQAALGAIYREIGLRRLFQLSCGGYSWFQTKVVVIEKIAKSCNLSWIWQPHLTETPDHSAIENGDWPNAFLALRIFPGETYVSWIRAFGQKAKAIPCVSSISCDGTSDALL
jgi:hypothetical protein